MKNYLFPSDILLPDFKKTNGKLWSCVACDQYTSEPEYWQAVDSEVGHAPSTLRLILPEVYLAQEDDLILDIHASMEKYLKDILISHPNSMIYLERKLSDGKVRRGIIGAIDLCDYDFRRGSDSLIRATEETVPERIPPRMKVRREALIELPHVMLLIDDTGDKVMRTAKHGCENTSPVYDHDLMQNGGHITGYLLDKETINALQGCLAKLARPEAMKEKYGKENIPPLLFAVGDGNHSLATAKACYDEIVDKIGKEAASDHPARYALTEVVNLWDESLEFEPIYRVLFGVDPENTVHAFEKYASKQKGPVSAQKITLVWGKGNSKTVIIPAPTSNLAVGSVQNFLGVFMKTQDSSAHIDYIHGSDTAKSLASQPRSIAFIYDGMAKSELFATVIADGALPRKTFSMGHAHDKRFYTEARKIIK